MEKELQSLEQTLKRCDTSGVEAALQMILQGSARVELKVGGITERVNTGDERMWRMEENIAQIDERTQLWKEKIGRARQCGKRADGAAGGRHRSDQREDSGLDGRPHRAS